MADQSGTRIKGYKLIERIGTGGFGAVYRSTQSTLGREVAIKVILPGFSNHPDFIRRFEIEAQLVAQLEHLHIIPLYDYWRDPSGAYLVMRWMRGGNLAEMLEKAPLEIAKATTLFDQVASGLSAAHRNGVIHRDIKPSNILLDEEGNAYLSDFGIAMSVDCQPDESGFIQGVGSPAYISPEQARQEKLTPQSDIYCLGITLYEILTGSHPFPHLTSLEQYYEHINSPLPQITGLETTVSSEINDLIQIATAKNPQKRFRDPLEMAAAFRKAVQMEIPSGELDPLTTLTKREIEIWKMISDGKTNKDIARDLFIELSTVKWHITQLYKKIDVRSRVQAIKLARETAYLSAMIPPDEYKSQVYNTASLFRPDLINPYKGLQPFESSDSHNYFGRESLVQRLLEILSGSKPSGRFIAVVGPSGSGKSSLVKAGLLPAIWNGELPGSQNWYTVEMTPDSRPLDQLEVALTRVAADQSDNIQNHLSRDRNGLLRAAGLILPNDDSQLVLFIDQFEEIFTLLPDEDHRKEFIDLLSTAVSDPSSRVILVITLRADFYDRPLMYPEFGELMRGCLEPVLPLSVQELESAIVQPSIKQGVSFETGLISRIIDDVNYQPSALPLLQYALMEMFDQIEERLITHQAYDSIGGTVGAVAKRAEDIYRNFQIDARDASRDLFLRLVSLNEESGSGVSYTAARRRVSRQDILAVSADEEIMDEVIDTFAAYRLLSLDHDPISRQPNIELAHEALLSEWDRYAAWVDEYSSDLLYHRRLENLADDWIANESDPSYLLRGSRLEELSIWTEETSLKLSSNSKSYLTESIELRSEQEDREKDRSRRELETVKKLAESESQRADQGFRAAKRMKRLLVGIAAALGAAVILAVLAFSAFKTSEKNRMIAESRELAAAAVSQLDHDPGLSILLALESISEDTIKDLPLPRESLEALHSAVLHSRIRGVIESQETKIQNGSYTPDGSGLLITYVDGSTRLLDSVTGEVVRTFSGHTSLIPHVSFHPSQKWMATCSRDHTARIWNYETGEHLLTIQDNNQIFNCVFNPDEDQLITVGNDINAKVWDISSGDLTKSLIGHSDYVSDVAITLDGSTIITSSLDGTIKIWDAATGSELRTLDNHQQRVQNIDISIDGKLLASASTDGTIIIWDAQTWDIRKIIHGHAASVLGVQFNIEGSILASAGDDQLINLWDSSTGQLLITLPEQTSTASGISFDSARGNLAASSLDGKIHIWDLNPASELTPLNISGGVGRVKFSSNGEFLAVPLESPGRVIIWNEITNDIILEISNDQGYGYTDISFSPDGELLAAAVIDGSVEVWNISHEEMIFKIDEQDDRVNRILFSPDGLTIVLASEDFNVSVWELESKTLIYEFEIGSSARSIAMQPSGNQLAVGSEAGIIQFFDLSTGLSTAEFQTRKNSVTALEYSPDGKYLASGSQDGSIAIWNVDARQESNSWPLFTSPITDLIFIEQESVLVAVGADGTVKIVAMDGWQEVLSLTPGDFVNGPVFGLAFAPSEDILSVAGENAVRFYTLDNLELVKIATERKSRDFSYQECVNYLHGQDCDLYVASVVSNATESESQLGQTACQITDVGGLQDNAINQNVNQGLITGTERYGWNPLVIETMGYQNMSQYIEEAINAGCDLITTLYFDMGGIAQGYALEYPDIDFLLLDYYNDPLPENTRAQIYATDQAAFLAGYAAASLTKSGIVGTFGGVNYPSVASFMIGFEQGVHYYNQQKDQQVIVLGWKTEENEGLFIGDFCCFEEGYNITDQLIKQGADIIMPVAGPFPGIGAAERAKDDGNTLIIGVDFDWAGMIPDFSDVVLTSVEKRFNVSVLNAIDQLDSGMKIGGLTFGTLASGDVGLSPFHGFEDQISQELKLELAEITEGIISGEILTSP